MCPRSKCSALLLLWSCCSRVVFGSGRLPRQNGRKLAAAQIQNPTHVIVRGIDGRPEEVSTLPKEQADDHSLYWNRKPSVFHQESASLSLDNNTRRVPLLSRLLHEPELRRFLANVGFLVAKFVGDAWHLLRLYIRALRMHRHMQRLTNWWWKKVEEEGEVQLEPQQGKQGTTKPNKGRRRRPILPSHNYHSYDDYHLEKNYWRMFLKILREPELRQLVRTIVRLVVDGVRGAVEFTGMALRVVLRYEYFHWLRTHPQWKKFACWITTTRNFVTLSLGLVVAVMLLHALLFPAARRSWYFVWRALPIVGHYQLVRLWLALSRADVETRKQHYDGLHQSYAEPVARMAQQLRGLYGRLALDAYEQQPDLLPLPYRIRFGGAKECFRLASWSTEEIERTIRLLLLERHFFHTSYTAVFEQFGSQVDLSPRILGQVHRATLTEAWVKRLNLERNNEVLVLCLHPITSYILRHDLCTIGRYSRVLCLPPEWRNWLQQWDEQIRLELQYIHKASKTRSLQSSSPLAEFVEGRELLQELSAGGVVVVASSRHCGLNGNSFGLSTR